MSDGLPDPTESMQLLERYQGGEQEALDELLRRYQEPLRRVVRIRLGGWLRAHLQSMDIVQDVNLVAMEKLKTFKFHSQGSLLHWLSAVVQNQIRGQNDYFRANIRDRDREQPLGSHAGQESRLGNRGIAPGAAPGDQAWSNEFKRILDQCMSELKDSHREVILNRDYLHMSWIEITEVMGRPSTKATERLYERAQIKLRRMLRPYLRDS